jgi:hypothetical protein
MDDKNQKPSKPESDVIKNTEKPLIPLCDKCKQPLTKCKCQHNILSK